MEPLIIRDTELFKVFMLWGGGVVILKMLLMSLLTGLQRRRKKVFYLFNLKVNKLTLLSTFCTLITHKHYNIIWRCIIIILFLGQVISTEEDKVFYKNAVVVYDDPDVNRMRRAHRNDMENIYAWLICTFLYLYCSPDPSTAGMLIRIFVICRILHTLVYAFYPVPQPTRAIIWWIGYVITIYESLYVMWFSMN